MPSLETIKEQKRLTRMDIGIRTDQKMLEEAARAVGTCLIEKDETLEDTALIYRKTKKGEKQQKIPW